MKKKKTSDENKILEFNQCRKSDKIPSTIFVDFDSLMKRIDGCKNNFKKIILSKSGLTYSLQVFSVYNLDA